LEEKFNKVDENFNRDRNSEKINQIEILEIINNSNKKLNKWKSSLAD
jgi:hypothetical protein